MKGREGVGECLDARRGRVRLERVFSCRLRGRLSPLCGGRLLGRGDGTLPSLRDTFPFREGFWCGRAGLIEHMNGGGRVCVPFG